MRNTVTFLTGRYLAMVRMAEGTGLIGMTGFALHQHFIYFRMATAADFLGHVRAEGNLERIMRIGMATQTVGGFQVGPVSFIVVTIRALRNLAVLNMTAGAGVLCPVFGIRSLQGVINLGMGRILMAVCTEFLGSVFAVGDHHRIVRSLMTAQAEFVFLRAFDMMDNTAVFTMTVRTMGNIAVGSMAVGAVQFGVFAGEILQCLRRVLMAADTHISGDVRNDQRTVGIIVAIMAGGYFRVGAVRLSVTSLAMGNGISVLNLARCIGMVFGMAELAGQLMPCSFTLEPREDSDMTLGTLLNGQRLDVLVKDGRPFRYFLHRISERNFVVPGNGRGVQAHQ